MIIALVNNKGGVGKTTTAVNLSAALAARGNRVLLCDLDSQASASLSLGVPRGELEPGSAAVLFEGVPVLKATRPTQVKNLDLLPGSMALANADLALAPLPRRERQLVRALAPVRAVYDYTLLDCPPSLSLLPVNALLAADAAIVPVTPHYLALEGLVGLLATLARVRENLGAGAELMGLLLTLADYRTRAAGEIAEMIRGQYRQLVFRTEVRISVKLAEAPSFGQTIFDYDNSSTGAEAYTALAGEVISRSRNFGK
jgi:chromosome partitioning protein